MKNKTLGITLFISGLLLVFLYCLIVIFDMNVKSEAWGFGFWLVAVGMLFTGANLIWETND